jgi:hypothetical protein
MTMKNEIVYVELKTGHNDDGPAWIGRARYSKSGRTVYFNGQALQARGRGGYENYFDIESGDQYWISGVKKDQRDRHWAGSGVIMIDEALIKDYLQIIKQDKLSGSRYKIVQLDNSDIRQRILELQNRKLTPELYNKMCRGE